MLQKIKTHVTEAYQKAKATSQETVKASGNYVVALDIGTEFVKALIARVDTDGAHVVGVGRAHQALTDMQTGAIADIAAVVRNCDVALAEAEKQAGVAATACVVGIAGELVKGTTTSVTFRRNEPTKSLDSGEVEDIIANLQEQAKARATVQIQRELGGAHVDIRLVNSAVVSMMIDGYKVTNPVGFQGKDVTVELYTAFAPMIHIGAIERVASELELELIAVAAEPFAVGRAMIGNEQDASMSAILIDVGGGTTDIAVLHEGGMQGTKMFGIGGRAFTKNIARLKNIDFEKAEMYKMAIGSGEKDDLDVLRAVQKTLTVWIDGVELALSEFTRLDILPHTIMLCGGGSSLKELVNILQTSPWYKQLPFAKKPSIQHIKPSSVVGVSDDSGSVTDHTFITAMGLLRVGIDTMRYDEGTAKPTSGLQGRLKKLMSK
jgi:cell division protein FtsA